MMSKAKKPKITAAMLLELLAQRHGDDVFVPECKDGPSQGEKHLRMDAWAMKKSWAHPNVFGYEIKVSRSDFLNDEKWRGYLPYCNSFSFVTAPGVIVDGELPEDVGWIIAASTGSRLFTKRKAQFRDVPIPENIWRYVLMCRAAIQTNHETYGKSKLAFWKRFVEGRTEEHELGRRASRKVRMELTERVDKVAVENRRLKREGETYEGVRVMLKELGFDPAHGAPDSWTVKRKIESAMERSAIPPGVVDKVQYIQNLIGELSASIESWDE